MSKVDTDRAEYTAMKKRWKLPMSLMGGTRAMRLAGKDFLPQEPRETDRAYERRLARAVLFNEFKRNIKTLSGYIFSKAIEKRMGDAEASLPDQLEEIWNDVDRDGTPLSEFAQELLEAGATAGFAHVLVDFPQNTGDGSRESDQALSLRPYFVLIKPESLIGWRTQSVNGKTELTQIRFKAQREVANGEWGGEEMVEQIIVIRKTEAGCERAVFEKSGEAKDAEWELVGEVSPMSISRIPLVTFYAARTGFMTAEPPFEDLAEMNARHWQSYADQANILHVARVPILYGKGMDNDEEDGQQEIGANAMITGPEGSDLKWVEHSGRAVEAGRGDIKDIEERMARMSIETYLTKQSATATEAGIDADQAMSAGQLISVNLGQALTKAFEVAAEWLDQDFDAKIITNAAFGLRKADAVAVSALNAARDRGDIPRKVYLERLAAYKILEDVDAEEIEELLELEFGSADDEDGDDLIDDSEA